jgi:prepilin-type N-terminal cleavage/methylation domain-containing protein
MTGQRHRRGGFTLIELLVVMAILIALTLMTIMVSTWSLDRDRAATAVNQLSGAAEVARSRAYAEGLPYGIRIVNNATQQAIAFQYIQSPAVFVFSQTGPADPTRYVEFAYTLDMGGQVTSRQCRIHGLNADQQAQFVPSAILYLPELGTYHRIDSVTPGNPMTVVLNDPSFQYGYPDDYLGGATHLRTYFFGLFGPPGPVAGEEVQQLAQDACVDLTPGHSFPPGTPNVDYDLLFAPNGKLVSVPNTPNTGAVGHVFLWVRDPGKPDNLQDGGEQLLFVVRSQSGAVGGAPIDRGLDPYVLARQRVAGH